MKTALILTKIYIGGVVKKVVWIVLCAVGIIFSVGIYWLRYMSEPPRAINQMVYGQVILSLIFMMIGIEINREERRFKCDILFDSMIRNKASRIPAKLFSIAVVDLLICLIIIIPCSIIMLADSAPSLWIKQSVLHLILLYFFPLLILGIWGLLISALIKGRAVYFPGILGWFVTSSLFTYVLNIIPLSSRTFTGIVNMLNLGIVNFQMYRNIFTVNEIELPRWIMRICILVTVTVGFILSSIGIGRKRLKVTGRLAKLLIVAVLLVTTCLVGISRYGDFFERFADNDDSIKYLWEKSDEYVAGMSTSLNDFPQEKNITIKSMDVELDCSDTGISANVTIFATQDVTAAEQVFTLYSDLCVDSVSVNGESAEFERSHDGILVRYGKEVPAGERVEISFSYHGYSLPVFPANETSVQLNASFPWIPWPGLKTTSEYQNDFYESEYFFVENWQVDKNVSYTLRYNGPGNLYCNLNDDGDSTYSGNSDYGISLYSGMLHEQSYGVDIYLPASLYDKAEDMALSVTSSYDTLSQFCEKLGAAVIPDKPETIVVLQMRVPAFIYSYQELYCRGNLWEIRMPNESSVFMETVTESEESVASYLESEKLNVDIAINLLLSPSVGFSADASGVSTDRFAQILEVYLLLKDYGYSTDDQYIERAVNKTTTEASECVNGILMTEAGLDDNETQEFNEILERMRSGEDFYGSFKMIYRQLISEKSLPLSEMLDILYLNTEKGTVTE